MQPEQNMKVHTRSGRADVEEPFEKPVILPEDEDQDPARHAWADARFAADIMSEHGLFFALLMPPEVANDERTQALRFASDFAELHKRIAAASAPDRGDLKRFTAEVIEAMKPFIEYKATLGDAQRNGTLHSLVWRCSSITRATKRSAGHVDWSSSERENPSSTERRWPRSGTTSWTSTLASWPTSSIRTSSSSWRRRPGPATCSGNSVPAASVARPPRSRPNPGRSSAP